MSEATAGGPSMHEMGLDEHGEPLAPATNNEGRPDQIATASAELQETTPEPPKDPDSGDPEGSEGSQLPRQEAKSNSSSVQPASHSGGENLLGDFAELADAIGKETGLEIK